MADEDDIIDEETDDDDEDIDGLFPEESDEDAEAIEDLEEEGEDEESEEQRYVQGLTFETDLQLDGTGNIVLSDPEDAWLDWCKKALSTPRYLCDSYSDNIGIDTEAAFEADSRGEAEEILRSEISDALEADPYGRTATVEEVEFEWVAPDAVVVTVIITGFDSIRATIETTIENFDMGGA